MKFSSAYFKKAEDNIPQNKLIEDSKKRIQKPKIFKKENKISDKICKINFHKKIKSII